MMTKAVALPISAIFCRWSLLKIRKTFNSKQIVALIGILIGVAWTTIASFDMSKEELLTSQQTTGYIMLGLSACFQAFEICLENRLFMIEPNLSALALQQAVSIWKVILIVALFVASNIFPDSLGALTGSNMESVAMAVKNLNEKTELYTYMFGLMFFNGIAANLGMQIIKDENAVFKQSAMLLPIPIMWWYNI